APGVRARPALLPGRPPSPGPAARAVRRGAGAHVCPGARRAAVLPALQLPARRQEPPGGLDPRLTGRLILYARGTDQRFQRRFSAVQVRPGTVIPAGAATAPPRAWHRRPEGDGETVFLRRKTAGAAHTPVLKNP